MMGRIWDKTIIEKLFIVGSSVRVYWLAVLYRSGFAPNVIKVTRVAFTAQHAEPIRDQPYRGPVNLFTTVDTGVQPGFNVPHLVRWRGQDTCSEAEMVNARLKKKEKEKKTSTGCSFLHFKGSAKYLHNICRSSIC